MKLSAKIQTQNELTSDRYCEDGFSQAVSKLGIIIGALILRPGGPSENSRG